METPLASLGEAPRTAEKWEGYETALQHGDTTRSDWAQRRGRWFNMVNAEKSEDGFLAAVRIEIKRRKIG